MHGKMRNTYRILFGNVERKRLFGRCRHRWKKSIKMVKKEIG
jgi:hypothetical protein